MITEHGIAHVDESVILAMNSERCEVFWWRSYGGVMASARKRESNKRNAQLSTGPKNTDASRFNAVTHGIFANQTYIESGLGPKER